MKQALLRTIQQMIQPGRTRKAKNAPIRIVLRRAHNRYRLRQHHLVPGTRVQVPRRQEAGLRWVRVDPAAHEQVVAVAEVEEFVVAFFRRVAGVGRADLVGYDEVVDEEGVGDEGAAEDATGFEVAEGVWVGEVEEGCS